MKRSTFLRYLGASALTTLGLHQSLTAPAAEAQGAGLTLQWFGHTSALFTGNGQRILVNPFRALGCTAGFRKPVPAVDFVLMSSRLLDEGAPSPNLPGNPRILFQAGAYTLNSQRYEGIAIPHDRLAGRRFGMNVVWKWQQAGINILHMGGAAGPIGLEERILMGQPDLAFVPVGGGPKAYNAEEAIAAIQALKPKIVIPTHYRTAAADGNACEIDGLDRFLSLVPGEQVTRISGQTLTLTPGNLPTAGPRFFVFRDPV